MPALLADISHRILATGDYQIALEQRLKLIIHIFQSYLKKDQRLLDPQTHEPMEMFRFLLNLFH